MNESGSKESVWKKLVQEIPRAALTVLGTALGGLVLAGIGKAFIWAKGLSLATTQNILTALIAFAVIIILLMGWVLFFRIRRKLRASEQHRFQDDFTFETRIGAYRHKTKPGLFCGSCTPKGVESPLKEQENGWMCQIKGCEHWHDNPDYRAPHREPMRMRMTNWLDGSTL